MISSESLIYVVILLIGVFIGAVSQVMLKKAALKTYSTKIREYVNPLVVTAYLLFFATTLLSVFAYKGIPISLGPVLEATSYVYVTIFGVVFFGEKNNYKKILAICIIILGIIIYSLFG